MSQNVNETIDLIEQICQDKLVNIRKSEDNAGNRYMLGFIDGRDRVARDILSVIRQYKEETEVQI